jgi:hypothetical protein
MRCETCKGKGEVFVDGWGHVVSRKFAVLIVPCPDCAGCGIMSCCDGMVEVDESAAHPEVGGLSPPPKPA